MGKDGNLKPKCIQAGHQAWRFNLGQFFLWLSHYGPEMVCLQGKTEEVTAM